MKSAKTIKELRKSLGYEALQTAIERAGGTSALARALGVSEGTVRSAAANGLTPGLILALKDYGISESALREKRVVCPHCFKEL